jgi:hypothetical protein
MPPKYSFPLVSIKYHQSETGFVTRWIYLEMSFEIDINSIDYSEI